MLKLKPATALPSNFWLDSDGNAIEAPVHTSPANDVLTAPLCAGRGQYHTDKREQLDTITLQQIRQMIEAGRDGLQTSDKHAGPWFIPSDQLTRSHEQHRNQGRYHALWFDADELQGLTMADSIEHAAGHIPGDFWAYASRSATEDNQKHRLIIPLSEPVDGYTWQIMQAILNDLMQAGGIQPDDVNERAGQLCYLPNPGEWYSFHVEELLGFLSPHQWADQIAAIKAADAAAAKAAAAKREESRRRAAELVKVQGVLPRTAYAEQVSSWDAWITYGAKPRGKRLLSPYSSSGSAAISIMESGKWVSHHGSDQAAGIGAPFPDGSGQWGDSFDLYCHFEHGGDEAAAVEAVAQLLDPEGQKQRQRDYMQQKAQDETLANLMGLGASDDDLEQIKQAAEQPAADQEGGDQSAVQWPEPVDVFAEYAAPPFPMETLPEQIRDWAEELAEQSGFSAGAYAFAALAALCNFIDHRARVRISSTYRQPAFIWAGLNDPSGGGKSAILGAATAPIQAMEDRRLQANKEALNRWRKAVENANKDGDNPPPKPLWKQRIATDVTTEALGDLLENNPEGINFFFDELTEFIGRMDAYSGGNGGKDRGTYIRAYDGKSATVNRRNRPEPQYIPHFSVGMFAGVQPEKLAVLFKQKGSQSDGLYQRFLMYSYPAAGDASFFAEVSPFTLTNYAELAERIDQWNAGTLSHKDAELCDQGRAMLQDYNNKMRKLSQRTPAARFREHLNRMPGIAFRLMFGLHVVEQAANGQHYCNQIKPETVERALQIMAVMYRHSEGVYEMLDSAQGDAMRLTRGAAEAILSKGWTVFKRGDLTRHATGWRDADQRQAEGAIDYLIELGWLKDVTPEPVRGKRGRKSDGLFMVNPAVHEQYEDHAHRVKRERAERYAAIQELAAERRNP